MRWSRCKDFPDYEVSDHGQVRRLTPGRGAVPLKLCRPWTDPEGRVSVSIRRDGKTVTVRVATLVCLAFVGPKPAGRYEVCHGDGVPGNNHWSNLRWGTSAENKADMIEHGTRIWGAASPNAKLSHESVAAIRRMWTEGKLKQREIASYFGVAQSAISKIIRGKRWRDPARPDI